MTLLPPRSPSHAPGRIAAPAPHVATAADRLPAPLAGGAGEVTAPAAAFQPDQMSWHAEPLGGSAGPLGPGPRGRDEMTRLLNFARADSAGRRPDGRCYMHVWRYIARSGYGAMPAVGIPDSHATYARQFAAFADANLGRLRLRKLPIDNPYEAPAGAIVVVAPGTPGTSHPVAGDIAIADGRGRFFNGGEMGYGGPGNFPHGNGRVLGVYVPA